jgi:hypothetical protein
MKLLIITFFSFLIFSASSKKINEGNLFSQLIEVNKEWGNHKASCPSDVRLFNSDIDRIQTHLFLVCEYLKENSSQLLNEKQKNLRLSLINELLNYAQKKIFPNNKYHFERTPYFVDDNNVHCAVGYLIDFSGSKDIVSKIRRDFNDNYIEDMNSKDLEVWAYNHGFSIEELKWIQPAYSPANNISEISNGTNGPVKKLFLDNYSGRIIVAGEFDSLDVLPCLNIGFYQNNQLSCLGSGIDGIINDIGRDQNGVYVFGEFLFEGITYPIAKYDGNNWNYIGIPNRENAIASSGLTPGGGLYPIEIAIKHASNPGKQEVWLLSNLGVWTKRAEVNGLILDTEFSPLGRVFAGHFHEVSIFNESGAIDSTFFTNNVIIRNYSNNQWNGVNQTDISDTVKAILSAPSGIYFGGTCSYSDNGVCITRYLNNVLQPILMRSDFSEANSSSVNSLAINNQNASILFGGNFKINPAVGTFGSNFAEYSLSENYIESLGYLDQPLNSIVSNTEGQFLGGEFKTNLSTSELNHLGKINSSFMEIADELQKSDVKISPNPFTSQIRIDGLKSIASYQLIDMNGSVYKSGVLQNNIIPDLENLSSGVYVLKIIDKNLITTHRIIK